MMKFTPSTTKPFWSLVILLGLYLVGSSLTIMSILRVPAEFRSNYPLISVIVRMAITAIVLLAEAIAYWALRDRFYRLSWVWGHVCLLYLILFVVPLISFLFIFIGGRYFTRNEFNDWNYISNTIRFYLFWSALVIAHIFFVLTIVKSYSTKTLAEPEANATPDLLDQFPG